MGYIQQVVSATASFPILGEDRSVFEGFRQVGLAMDNVGITSKYNSALSAVSDQMEDVKEYFFSPDSEGKKAVSSSSSTSES